MLIATRLEEASMQVLMLQTELQVTVLQEATQHLIAKPLLLRLGDKSEACREAAIQALIGLLQVLTLSLCCSPHVRITLHTHCVTLQAAPDAVLALLPYAIPVLEERLQGQEVCPPCTSLHQLPSIPCWSQTNRLCGLCRQLKQSKVRS